MKTEIVLASGSPRRKELLKQVGLSFEICPAKGEEVMKGENPEEIVKELATQKAFEVYRRYVEEGCIEKEKKVFIGADTVVAYEGKILGKPMDEADAYEMIEMLQGKKHQVHTGVCVIVAEEKKEAVIESFASTTQVEVYPMSKADILDYIETGEPMDKAGAYGIQGYFAQYIKGIEGDYANAVGLPVGRLCKLLRDLKIVVHEVK